MLALLVFASSSSFMVNMHYCGGHVQSVSLIEKATPCPMEVQLPPCHKKETLQSGCCEDKGLAFEGKDFSSQVKDMTSFTSMAGWVSELPLIMEIIQITESVTSNSHTAYRPPIVERDITVLVQTFLI